MVVVPWALSSQPTWWQNAPELQLHQYYYKSGVRPISDAKKAGKVNRTRPCRCRKSEETLLVLGFWVVLEKSRRKSAVREMLSHRVPEADIYIVQ